MEKKGYVAIDFYEGSILYDFKNSEIKICDIDFYTRSPYINKTGKMWGSKRFMSPEEFIKGGIIDGVTNVYTMGAMAFCLIGNDMDRGFNNWEGSESLFQVAKRATDNNRAKRYKSISDFYSAWIKCTGKMNS